MSEIEKTPQELLKENGDRLILNLLAIVLTTGGLAFADWKYSLVFFGGIIMGYNLLWDAVMVMMAARKQGK